MKAFVISDGESVRPGVAAILASVPSVGMVDHCLDSLITPARLRASGPDLVILDLQETKRRVLEVLLWIRDHPPIPRIMVLASPLDPTSWYLCCAAGADYAFDPLISTDRIVAALRRLGLSRASRKTVRNEG